MEGKYKIEDLESGFFINNYKISQETEEEVNYQIRDREEFIDDLIDWMTESKKENDIYLIKEDLKYLSKCKDRFILSNLSTNKYILEENDLNEYNKICQDLINTQIKINKEEIKNDNKKMEEKKFYLIKEKKTYGFEYKDNNYYVSEYWEDKEVLPKITFYNSDYEEIEETYDLKLFEELQKLWGERK